MSISADISEVLDRVAAGLDMPQALYEAAIARYEEVGEYLGEKDKDLNRGDPQIYSQGSFRLGTIIRPANDANDYDIDLVYLRDLQRTITTQEKLKSEAGDRLKDYVAEQEKVNETVPKLTEGRRCWTLDYAHLGFHMDVLPAIPNDRAVSALLVTDRELTRWQHSDPIGYANWFWSRMAVEVTEAREKFAKDAQASVADVPNWKIKTTLQRAVQLLKRHRDHRYGDDGDRPISIIITTLAAKAYQRQGNLFDALQIIVRDMTNHIEDREGVYWVPNPVNPGENFADKWKDQPEKAEKFFEWLAAARHDFGRLQTLAPTGMIKEAVRQQFGQTITEQAMASLQSINSAAAGSIALAAPVDQVPGPTSLAHRQAPKWMMIPTYKVTVRSDVFPYKDAARRLWTLGRYPVNKKMSIRFLAETDVPSPFEVHWQITNTGAEATERNQLRGGFQFGNGNAIGSTNWESTSYAGTHYVEAFVIRGGICHARSGQIPVEIRPI